MRVSLPVRYLPVAQEDILNILEFLAYDSPSRAATFTNALDHRIGDLSSHPHLERIPRHPRLKSMGYRVLVVGSHLVFYLIRPAYIEIHRVVHTSRDLDRLF
jgi:toxin ParE1/3/4